MDYAENGNLRKNLPNINNDKWIDKLRKLYFIIKGLDNIHQQKLVHCDFHHGNILLEQKILSISDLGLCKPVEDFQSSKKGEIYGVLPFVAPEILRGKPYISASDIYSFSMIMWEFISGFPPFHDRKYDFLLALNICKGERPEIIENTPQCYIDLMKKCWNEDPLKRPNASEISNTIKNWYEIIGDIDKTLNNIENDILLEFWKAEEKQTDIQTNDKPIIKSHPQAYHTSRLLDFTEKLNEILDQKDKEIYGYNNNQSNRLFETGISQSIGNYFKILNMKILNNCF